MYRGRSGGPRPCEDATGEEANRRGPAGLRWASIRTRRPLWCTSPRGAPGIRSSLWSSGTAPGEEQIKKKIKKKVNQLYSDGPPAARNCGTRRLPGSRTRWSKGFRTWPGWGPSSRGWPLRRLCSAAWIQLSACTPGETQKNNRCRQPAVGRTPKNNRAKSAPRTLPPGKDFIFQTRASLSGA